MKIASMLTATALAGASVLYVAQPVSAVPVPTVCLPYVADTPTTLGGTYRVTVKVCTPVDDNDTAVSVCERVVVLRPGATDAVVRDTCV